MKKRSPAPHLWKKKVALLLTAVVFVFSVLKLHAQFKSHLTSNYRYLNQPYSGKPKIAFLFLVRNRLPLDFVWQRFFQGAEEPVFSIYIHSKPGFVFNQFTTTCTFCYNRQLEESIQVDWGEASMIEAERILLRKALQDPANQRFILVSDSCVPLYNFSFTYNYVMSSSKSFVDSFLDTKGGRYNPKMAPTIPKDKWRKGSQWFTLTRKHAVVMEVDNTIFPIFKRHCKRRPPLPEFLRKQVVIGVVQKEHNCIPDEHYVQTLLAMRNLEQELERRTLTYTLWNQTAKEIEMQGWHPVTFKHADVDAGLVENIKGEIVGPAVRGTMHLLKACKRSGTVKRIIHTSSVAAANYPGKIIPGDTVDESYWTSVDYCRKTKMIGWMYFIAKTYAEEGALKFGEENGVDIISILPSVTAGGFLTPHVPGSVETLMALTKGDDNYVAHIPRLPYVHIDDLARAYIFLYENPRATGRFICSLRDVRIEEVAQLLSKRCPELSIPTRFENLLDDYLYPCVDSTKLIKLGFEYQYSFEDIIDDVIKCYKEKGLL